MMFKRDPIRPAHRLAHSLAPPLRSPSPLPSQRQQEMGYAVRTSNEEQRSNPRYFLPTQPAFPPSCQHAPCDGSRRGPGVVRRGHPGRDRARRLDANATLNAFPSTKTWLAVGGRGAVTSPSFWAILGRPEGYLGSAPPHTRRVMVLSLVAIADGTLIGACDPISHSRTQASTVLSTTATRYGSNTDLDTL